MDSPGFARDAIFHADGRVVGYEIRMTGSEELTAETSAALLLDAFSSPDLVAAGNGHALYIPVAPQLLTALDIPPVPPDRVVLELPARAASDDAVREAIGRLASRGYALALRDVPAAALLDVVDGIRTARISADHVDEAVAAAMRARAVEVHALEVHDWTTLEACAEAGCDAFQGRARWTADGAPVTDTVALVPELLDHRAGLDELITAVERDPALNLRLLRFVNSAFFSLRSEVTSARRAAIVLGERMLRRWAFVAALAARPRPGGRELLVDSLVRARAMELVAEQLPGLDRDVAFTVGLYAGLPALLGRPAAVLLDGLPVDPAIVEALAAESGPYASLLRHVEAGDGGPRVAAALRLALAWVQPIAAELDAAAPRLAA